jgi:hypothetical protein
LTDFTLEMTAEKSLSSGLMVSSVTTVPPPSTNAFAKAVARPCPYAFLSLIVATCLMPWSRRYFAANGPCTSSVVQVRK